MLFMINRYLVIISWFLCLNFYEKAEAQTIAEKKAGIYETLSDFDPETEKLLKEINQDISSAKKKLAELFQEAGVLYENQASEKEYGKILEKIRGQREEIEALEELWQESYLELNQGEEGYALWHQPETTVSQLIIDYGSHEYVYLIPPLIGEIKLSINSNLPIPRASWSEMLEFILSENGIGIRQISPYLRQLFLMKETSLGVIHITAEKHDLEFFPEKSNVCFLLSPGATEARRVFQFLSNFICQENTRLQIFGSDIVVIAPVKEIKELLKVYEFILVKKGNQEYRLVALSKISPEEMKEVLGAIFSEDTYRSGASAGKKEEDLSIYDKSSMLKVIPLMHQASSLFLFGSKEEVGKAEEIIRQIEGQIGDAREKILFWYTCKHSEASELANVLERVYHLLIHTETTNKRDKISRNASSHEEKNAQGVDENAWATIVVNPGMAVPGNGKKDKKIEQRQNFIVDPKTGSIVMVVAAELLPTLRELLKRLDVPKKMVQIEVLFFEKKMNDRNNFGMNLLKLGSSSIHTRATGAIFDNTSTAGDNKGVLQFIMSRTKNGAMPAFDLAYNFLLSQEDVQINASPTVTTVNQTPAKIVLVEEISISTGSVIDTTNHAIKDSYTRSQYGIILNITPTVHEESDSEMEERGQFITLETDIYFDTTSASQTSRPDVTRRNIKNEVRVADGETVILGGLRRKISQDGKSSIPFLGEIPGIGKLFSTTGLYDSSTEMFIFLTPRIIADPLEGFKRMRQEELRKRPGDIPEFLHEVVEARNREKRKKFEGGLKMLLGRNDNEVPAISCGEYDGR